MNAHRELLLRSCQDMLRALRHVADELHEQLRDPTVIHIGPAKVVLSAFQTSLLDSARRLDEYIIREFGPDRPTFANGGSSHFSEYLASLYAQLGPRSASEAFRNDCVAAHSICASLSSLRTVASALDCNEPGQIASDAISELAPILIELDRVLPQVIVSELMQTGYSVNLDAVKDSVRDLEAAWEEAGERTKPPHFLARAV